MNDPIRGPWIPTYSGRCFYIFDPRPEEVLIADIAHAHSLDNRWASHTRWSFVVGQHCVLASFHGPEIGALDRLLHDAPEAYLRDLSRWVKEDPRFAAYRETEKHIAEVVAEAFDLDPNFWTSESTRRIDRGMAIAERDLLFPQYPEGSKERPLFEFHPVIRSWSHIEAEIAFLVRFGELTGRSVEQELRAALDAFAGTGQLLGAHPARLMVELALLIARASRSADARIAAEQARQAFWLMLGIETSGQMKGSNVP